jgi:RNA polymerase sigma-70 factor (ECF subfamily)
MARIATDDLRRIAHDPEALGAFYLRHVEDVQRFVARRVDEPQLAADLTADVFVAAIESAGSYRPSRGRPIAWLFGVARIVVADERRRGAREERAMRRVAGRELLEADDIARMHARIDAAARARSLCNALQGLPEAQRSLLELTAIDGLTVAEAARCTGMRAVSARVTLHRARLAMRDALANEDSTPTPRPTEASS